MVHGPGLTCASSVETVLAAEQGAAFRRAAERATLAPSVHNTQPWRLVLGPAGLEIGVDRSRQLAVLDPTGRQLYLSVGCAVFNARVSLAASGFATMVQRGPDPTQPDVLVRIRIIEADEADEKLSALDTSVRSRQTNRRRFADDAVPSGLVSVLVNAAATEGADLLPVTGLEDRQTLARLSQRADAAQISDPAYRAELRAWTTRDPDRRDGVPARVVPHVNGDAHDDVPIRDFDSQGAGWLPTETRSSMDQCLLVLGTYSDDPGSWLRAGEALERVWLEVTRAGFVASVFTQVIEVAELRGLLREQLHIGPQPHVVLRVGHAPATPGTSRRRLDEVFDDLTRPRRPR